MYFLNIHSSILYFWKIFGICLKVYTNKINLILNFNTIVTIKEQIVIINFIELFEHLIKNKNLLIFNFHIINLNVEYFYRSVLYMH